MKRKTEAELVHKAAKRARLAAECAEAAAQKWAEVVTETDMHGLGIKVFIGGKDVSIAHGAVNEICEIATRRDLRLEARGLIRWHLGAAKKSWDATKFYFEAMKDHYETHGGTRSLLERREGGKHINTPEIGGGA